MYFICDIVFLILQYTRTFLKVYFIYLYIYICFEQRVFSVLNPSVNMSHVTLKSSSVTYCHDFGNGQFYSQHTTLVEEVGRTPRARFCSRFLPVKREFFLAALAHAGMLGLCKLKRMVLTCSIWNHEITFVVIGRYINKIDFTYSMQLYDFYCEWWQEV